MLSAQPNIEALLETERLRPLRRVEYERLGVEGFFDEDDRVELLEGVIVQMSPRGIRHDGILERLNRLFVLALLDRAAVRPQLAYAASDISEPEPDLAIVPLADHTIAHPSEAFLLIEVSDSSLSKDRRVKSRIYAASSVPEYWVVDVNTGTIEVRTEPGAAGYGQLRVARPGDAIRLQAFSDVEIAVSDVLR